MKDVERKIKVSIERVREESSLLGIDDRIVELDASSATVELAAKALGCEPKNIAKSGSSVLNVGRSLSKE